MLGKITKSDKVITTIQLLYQPHMDTQSYKHYKYGKYHILISMLNLIYQVRYKNKNKMINVYMFITTRRPLLIFLFFILGTLHTNELVHYDTYYRSC